MKRIRLSPSVMLTKLSLSCHVSIRLDTGYFCLLCFLKNHMFIQFNIFVNTDNNAKVSKVFCWGDSHPLRLCLHHQNLVPPSKFPENKMGSNLLSLNNNVLLKSPPLLSLRKKTMVNLFTQSCAEKSW